jgi:hypothetical protein
VTTSTQGPEWWKAERAACLAEWRLSSPQSDHGGKEVGSVQGRDGLGTTGARGIGQCLRWAGKG